MVDPISEIEDREERNRAARAIINIMGNLNPHLRDVADFKHKLWDHLAIMSDFKLDIDSPYEKPEPEIFKEKPRRVPYKEGEIKYKHYGRMMEKIIDIAAEMEESDEKDLLIEVIANHMKKSYLTWNREAVDDSVILKDLEELSGGRIKPGPVDMTDTREFLSKARKKRQPRKK